MSLSRHGGAGKKESPKRISSRAVHHEPLAECAVCMAVPPSVRFHPCGHACMCGPCVRKVRGEPTCVLCRAHVTRMDVIKPPVDPEDDANPMARLLSQAESVDLPVSEGTANYVTPPGGAALARCAVCQTQCKLRLAGTANRLYWSCPHCNSFKAWAAGKTQLGAVGVPCNAVLCPYCDSVCSVSVSASAKNPGKRYWKCPGGVTKNGKRCARCFVMWAE